MIGGVGMAFQTVLSQFLFTMFKGTGFASPWRVCVRRHANNAVSVFFFPLLLLIFYNVNINTYSIMQVLYRPQQKYVNKKAGI